MTQQDPDTIADMAKLKAHPREETVNRLLVRRAERVYAELPRGERDMLADLLDGFEEALSLKDSTAIERFRVGTADDGRHAGIFGVLEYVTDFIFIVFDVNDATAHEDQSGCFHLLVSFPSLSRRALQRKMHVL